MGVAKTAKLTLLRAAKGFGVFSAVQDSKWRQRRLVVLCYHGVSIEDEHEWSPSFYMSPASFEARMRTLRDGGYSVLPLGDAVQRLHAGTLPPRSVALTFDDGSADFSLRAFPILEHFDFPATVYLTTYYCGRPTPVFGVFCSYMLWKGRGGKRLSKALVGQAGAWDLTSAGGRQVALADIHQYVATNQLCMSEKEELSSRLAADLCLDYRDLVNRRILQIMSPDEIGRLAECGVDFQLHTHRHRLPRDRHLFDQEITENRAWITALAKRNPEHFCYPSGMYEHLFLQWLREGGIRSATTCESGIASQSTEPLLLPRVVDGGQLTALEFEAWLTGAAAMLPRRVAHTPVG